MQRPMSVAMLQTQECRQRSARNLRAKPHTDLQCGMVGVKQIFTMQPSSSTLTFSSWPGRHTQSESLPRLVKGLSLRPTFPR
jgi:hypothetical protein